MTEETIALFLDCDGTLVLWGDNGAGGINTDYTINVPLIEAVNEWQSRDPGRFVIVWSGGGKDYAERWRQIAEHYYGLVSEIAVAKAPHLLKIGAHVIVDDEPKYFKDAMLPEDFIQLINLFPT